MTVWQDVEEQFCSEGWKAKMLNINKTSGTVVASETQDLAAAIDSTMLAQARLTASILETACEAKAPVAATQKLLRALSDNMTGLVSSRADFVTAVRELTVLQSHSNLKEMATGCPNGLAPMKGSASDLTPVSEDINV
jgi:hypothetical protein